MALTINSYNTRKENVRQFYATGSGALAESIDIGRNLKIEEIRLHLGSAATQENLVVTVNSGKGAAYDINLLTVDMSQDADANPGVVTDVVWRPSPAARLDSGDTLDISWTNTDAATWGLEIITRTFA